MRSPEMKLAEAETNKKYVRKHPEVHREGTRKYQANNMDKMLAQIYANRYCKKKESCEWCGSKQRLVMHHSDYTQPLKVVTICTKCHKEWHKHNTPIRNPNAVLPIRHCDSCEKTYPSCGRYRSALHGRSCSLWEKSLGNLGETKLSHASTFH